MTYGDGKFVAVGDNGTNRVMVSDDGITWTLHNAVEQNEWYGVAYGDGKFVASAYNDSSGSSNQRIMTSSDGITWTFQTALAGGWYAVTYGNGLFVAVAPSGTYAAMTSSNATAWTSRTVPSGAWFSVTFGNGMHIAVAYNGKVMKSGTYALPSSEPEPEQMPAENPAPVVTTTVAPATTTIVPTVKKLNKLPETGSSISVLLFAAITVALGGAVTVLRRRVTQ